MSNIRFLHDNLWDLDDATLTANSEAIKFPKENTQRIWHKRHWRSTGLSSEWLKINIGSPVTDGEFEVWTTATDLTNWLEYTSGTSTVNRESIVVQEGTYSVRLNVDASNSKVYIYQAIDLVPGKKYKLSLWYKHLATSRVYLYDAKANVYLDSNSDWQASDSYITMGSAVDWTKKEIEFYAHDSYAGYIIALQNLSAASASLYFDDLQLARAVDAIIIKYHNLQTGNATASLEGNYSDSWGSPPLDQSLTITKDLIIKYLSATENYDWYRLLISDSGNPDSYIRIGRVYLGSYFEPSRNNAQPVRKQYVDPSVKRYSTGGQVSICKRDKYIVTPYNFPSILSSEVSDFVRVWNNVGQSEPYFVCESPDSDPHLTTYYIENVSPWDINEIYTKGSLQINAREMR